MLFCLCYIQSRFHDIIALDELDKRKKKQSAVDTIRARVTEWKLVSVLTVIATCGLQRFPILTYDI